MLTDLIEFGRKMKHQMKDTQNEINQNIQRTNNLEQEEEIKIKQEQNEETRIQKNEERLRNL